MKKFYINGIVFVTIFLMLLVCLDIMSMKGACKYIFAQWTNSSNYFGGGPDEIIPYIDRAQTADSTTKLIIGDSVCHQMFNGLQEINSDFSIIGSNGAITMAGQYILTKEYLENHPSATDVFLIVLPESLGRTFDTKWGYQYTVMPFAATDTLNDLDDDTLQTMADTYGKMFLNKKVVSALYESAVNRKLYLNTLADKTPGYILSNHFEIADQYVVKIAELCNAKGVNFHLYSCPVSENKRENTEGLQEAFENSKMYRINPDFLKTVYYFPPEQASDNTHFSGEYANQECFNEKIQYIYSDEVLLDYLKFE